MPTVFGGRRARGKDRTMRILLVVALVSAIGFVPIAAIAQSAPTVPDQPPAQSTESASGMRTERLLIVGAGIVVGAAVGAYILTFDGSMILGGIAGGLIANWWYGPSGRTISLPGKTAIKASDAVYRDDNALYSGSSSPALSNAAVSTQ
jgi:hypothetical protein